MIQIRVVNLHVQLNDVDVYYRQYGSGSRPVLCFHGWSMSADSWLALASFFPSEHFRLVMPDLRGFGRSSKPAIGYHINDYMRDAVRLARSLGISRFDLLGHSFGGTGALYLACRIPHLVRRVVVISTIPGSASPLIDSNIRRHFERIYALVERASDRTLPTLLTRLWRAGFLGIPDSTQIEAQRQAAQRSQRHAILATLNTILTTDISQWLVHLKTPTLVIRGDQDPLLQDGPDGLDNLAHITRVVIPQSGHYPHMENSSATFAAIEAFLR